MTESRTELVIWVNNLLAFRYTKVEQLGTGVAYSQIIDSIYGDVHLAKIKFQAKHEYEFIDNYKVLQRSFEKHKIDKIIPVERLVKCRFQDNLEFLQWIKLFWDTNYQGGAYDAVGRRQRGINKAIAILSSPAPPIKMRHGRLANHSFSDLGSCASLSSTSSSTVATSLETPIDTGSTISGTHINVYSGRNCQSPSSSSTSAASSKFYHNKAKRSRTHNNPRSSSSMSSSNRTIMDLNQQLGQLQITIDSLHVEKDFYYRKLDKIKDTFTKSDHSATTLLLSVSSSSSSPASSTLQKIGTLLYDTEERF